MTDAGRKRPEGFFALPSRKPAPTLSTIRPVKFRRGAAGLGRMFQTPFSDQIRNEAHVDTIAVGAISEADHVNSIVAAGRADLCAIARPHLADPAWTLHEAAKIGVADIAWPKQYYSAKAQYEANLARAAAAQAAAT
jgi:2,4-dienoyl-CoA reductase-like NADH-dependent reductase (Old Yellow Enzyme family)